MDEWKGKFESHRAYCWCLNPRHRMRSLRRKKRYTREEEQWGAWEHHGDETGKEAEPRRTRGVAVEDGESRGHGRGWERFEMEQSVDCLVPLADIWLLALARQGQRQLWRNGLRQ